MGRLGGARSLALTVALLMTVPASPTILAEHDGSHAGTLPTPLVGADAVEWRDGSVYVFGGRVTTDRFSNDILRHDPVTGTVTKVAEFPPASGSSTSEERLPGRYQGAAVALGDRIYYLGGAVLTRQAFPTGEHHVLPESIPDIVEFDPANGTTRRVAASLPEGAWGIAAASDGTSILVFGGLTFDTGETMRFTRHDRVLRFEPTADGKGRVTMLDAKLPFPVQDQAVTASGRIFLAGGLGQARGWDHVCLEGRTVCPSNAVVTFDPATERVEGVTARLPERLTFTDAVHAEGRSLVVGGLAAGGEESRRILAFTDTSRVAARLHATLPQPTYGMAAVWQGGALLTYGGISGGNATGDISRTTGADGERDLAPEPPRNLTTRPAEGGVALTWDPAAAPSPDSYRVYRREAGAVAAEHVADVEGNAFVDRSARANTAYEYRVTALHDGLEGAYSAAATGAWTALTAPTKLVAETVGKYVPGVERTIDLRWAPPEHEGPHPVTGYRVYRSVDGGAWTWLADTPAVTSFTDDDAPTLSDVAYRVSALTRVQESAPSDAAVVTVADSALHATPLGGVR